MHSDHYPIIVCWSPDPIRAPQVVPPLSLSSRLSLAVLILLVCPASSIYVNRPSRLERRVLRSLASDIKKIYVGLMYSANGFYRLPPPSMSKCYAETSNNGILSIYTWMENKETKKRKGVLFPLLLIFCLVFSRPSARFLPVMLANATLSPHHLQFAQPATSGLSTAKDTASQTGPPLHSGLQSISGSTLEFWSSQRAGASICVCGEPAACFSHISTVNKPISLHFSKIQT